MSTLSRIDEYLARCQASRLLCESVDIDGGIVKMIVDALPELCFNDDFKKKLTGMLADKLSDDQISKISQVLVTELPARAENILKGIQV